MAAKRSFSENLDLCLAHKCPVCGEGELFKDLRDCSHVKEWCFPVKNCEVCGFVFQRESGYYSTVFVPFLPIASNVLGVIAGLLVWFLVSESAAIAIGVGVLTSFVSFFVLMRPMIAVFIAFDHTVDPPASGQSTPH